MNEIKRDKLPISLIEIMFSEATIWKKIKLENKNRNFEKKLETKKSAVWSNKLIWIIHVCTKSARISSRFYRMPFIVYDMEHNRCILTLVEKNHACGFDNDE